MSRSIKRLAGLVFAYEAVALVSHRTWPTLTRLSARHTWVKPVLVGALVFHLFPPYLLDGATPEKGKR